MNVVTLCGSTKFKTEFENIAKEFTLKGYVVLTLNVFSHADGLILSNEEIDILHQVHRQKIDMADLVFIINKNGYIGSGLKDEIMYAAENNKKIDFLEEPPLEIINLIGQ